MLNKDPKRALELEIRKLAMVREPDENTKKMEIEDPLG